MAVVVQQMVRKRTAEAMVASAFTAPHVTEFITFDISATMELVEKLQRMGHSCCPIHSPHGGGQAILIDRKAGHFIGGSDPRKDGLALGF